MTDVDDDRSATDVDDVGFAAEVDARATAAHPTRLTVAVTNRSDEPWTYPVWPPDVEEEGHRVPFDGFEAERDDGDGTLYLIPEFDRYMSAGPDEGPLVPDERSDGCWQVGYDGILTASIASQRATLRPGESFAETYALLDGSDGGCTPPGTYPFATEKRVTADDRESVVVLGFDVEVGTDGAVSTVVPPPTVERRSTTEP